MRARPLKGAAAPTAAAAPANRSVTGSLTGVLTAVSSLTWTKPVTQATASAVIGAAGGSISIPNGVRLIVPRGAVSSNVTFSVTRLPGNLVAYDFQPHGIQFAEPVTIQQPTLGTSVFKLPATALFRGAYFPSTGSLDQSAGTALVSEFEPTSVSADRAWITFTVRHFSGYMVSWGAR